MRKWIIIIACSIAIFVAPIIWWASQSTVSNGIYPDKRAGSIVLVRDNGIGLTTFSLPVKWVKKFPWSKKPTIEEIILKDENGKTISILRGEYLLPLDDTETRWYKRIVRADLELLINGNKKVSIGQTNYHPMDHEDSLKKEYILDEMELIVDGKMRTFPMEDTYKFFIIPEQKLDGVYSWNMNAMQKLYKEEELGYIFRLEGPKGDILQQILFWLPGMKDISEAGVLYTFEDEFDLYTNSRNEFIGEPLSLPLTLETNNMLIFIPYSKAIKEKVDQSIVYTMPYFKFISENGDEYYNGGMGSVGPFYPEREEHQFILPIFKD